MEKYIDTGVESFIELVEEESTYYLHYISGADPNTILKLFDKNQLLVIVDEVDTDRGIESYNAYALLESGKLLRFCYGYAPNGLLDVSVQFFENGDKFTVKRYRIEEGRIQISDEEGKPFLKEETISGTSYRQLLEEVTLKDVIVPISVEQMKNRGIIALDSSETNSVIYQLVEYINSHDYEQKGCVFMSDISMQDSHIDDIFDDNQLVSASSIRGDYRWAIVNRDQILQINCMPVGNKYCYSFELSVGMRHMSTDPGRYYVDEVLNPDTGKTYFNVRCNHEETNYGNEVKVSSKVIRNVIKDTDINQLIERSKEQFRK